MAILEPAVVESTFAGCITVLREAMEAAISMGVPSRRPGIFVSDTSGPSWRLSLGSPGFPLSDGAMKAIEQNRAANLSGQLEGCHYHTCRPAKCSRYLYGKHWRLTGIPDPRGISGQVAKRP